MAKFDDLEKANAEIERLSQFESQATELTKERDKLNQSVTDLTTRLEEAGKGAESLNTKISEKDASIEALQSQMNEAQEKLGKLDTDYVGKETHDNLHNDFVTTLKNQLKNYNLSDTILENKTIDQLKAMSESLSAVQGQGRGNGSQPPANPAGYGMGSDGTPTDSTPKTPLDFELSLIEKAKNNK